ncbi:MAG: proton-conducting transporter membrane subunit [Fimbriimonas sp.]
MTNLIALPIVVPLGTAAACLLAWNQPRRQRVVSLVGAFALVIIAVVLLTIVLRTGPQVLHVGGWRAPFGISLVADTIGVVLVAMTAVVGLAVVVDSLKTVGPEREAYGYHPLVHILLMGVGGAFLTGDLFNLYVWFEVLLISSFVLLSLGAERPQLEAALKYVTLNLIASSVFLCALGLMYGTLGTLNLADLAQRLANGEGRGFGIPLSMMFLVAFGVKAGLVPLHAWLPASYHTPPASVSALFAGLLTKVGVVALLKVFLLAFRFDPPMTDTVLAWMAGMTMLFGGIGAMVQNDLRRLLAFSVLNGIGAMVMGISLRSEAGTSATVLYMLHSAVATVAAFLLAGEVHRRTGHYDLRQMGGLARVAPGLSVAWFIVALALVGVPPLSGFFGKLALVRAGIQGGQGWSVGILLGSSLLVLAAFLRAWNLAFAREGEGGRPGRGVPLAGATLAAGTVAFAFLLAPLAAVCARIGFEMARPEDTVIGTLGTPDPSLKPESVR